MFRLSLSLIILACAYLIYLLAPVPALAGVPHDRLQPSLRWSTGDLQIMKEYEEPASDCQYWLLGSSVASSFFPIEKLSGFFDKNEARMLHLSWAKMQHIDTVFGDNALLSPPKTVVFMVSADLLLNRNHHPDLSAFKFLRLNRAMSWRMSFSQQLLGNDVFVLNDVSMTHHLVNLKRKESPEKIIASALKILEEGRNIEDKEKRFESELKSLETFATYLKKKNVTLRFVILPMQKVMFEEESPLPENLNKLKKICEAHRVPVLDVSKTTLDIDVFIDWGHFSPLSGKLEHVRKEIIDWVKAP